MEKVREAHKAELVPQETGTIVNVSTGVVTVGLTGRWRRGIAGVSQRRIRYRFQHR